MIRALVLQSFKADESTRATAIEALCKLYVQGVLVDAPILAKLLRDLHHPHSARFPRLRNILHAFFPYFLMRGASARVLMEKALETVAIEVVHASPQDVLGHVDLCAVMTTAGTALRQ